MSWTDLITPADFESPGRGHFGDILRTSGEQADLIVALSTATKEQLAMSFFEDLGHAVEKVGTAVADTATSALHEVGSPAMDILKEMRGAASALPSGFPGAELFEGLLNNPLDAVKTGLMATPFGPAAELAGSIGSLDKFASQLAKIEDKGIQSLSDGYLNSEILGDLVDPNLDKIAKDLASVEDKAIVSLSDGYLNSGMLGDLVDPNLDKIAKDIAGVEDKAIMSLSDGYLNSGMLGDLVDPNLDKIAKDLAGVEDKAVVSISDGYLDTGMFADLLDLNLSKNAANIAKVENRAVKSISHGFVDISKLAKLI